MEIDGDRVPQTIDGDSDNRTNSIENAVYIESNANDSASDISSIVNKSDGFSDEIHRSNGMEVDEGNGAPESDYSKLLGNNDLGIGYVDDDDLDTNELGASGFANNAEISSDVHDIAIGMCAENPMRFH